MKKRHLNSSIRQPEAINLSRATSFNKQNVALFFNNLRCLQNYFSQNDLWNMDERAVTTVQEVQEMPMQVVESKKKPL